MAKTDITGMCSAQQGPILIPGLAGMDSGQGVVLREELGVGEVRTHLQKLLKCPTAPVSLQCYLRLHHTQFPITSSLLTTYNTTKLLRLKNSEFLLVVRLTIYKSRGLEILM